MENTIIICKNIDEFTTTSKFYNKDFNGKYDTYPKGFRITSLSDIGHASLDFYQENRPYKDFKFISFTEWLGLTNQRKEVTMKYVVEVNNQEEQDAVVKQTGKKPFVQQRFPYHLTSTGEFNEASDYHRTNKTAIERWGPLLSFEQFAAMFGIVLKPNKKLKLTNDYTAEVDYTKQVVQVGCQSIPFSKVEALAKLIKE